MRKHVVFRDTPASPQGLPSLGEGLGAGTVAYLSDIIANGERYLGKEVISEVLSQDPILLPPPRF